MQVNNQSTIPTSISNEILPLTLKEGDVMQATVKEKLSNNEAILQMKGQEMKVKFQGTVPSNGRISIEVTNTNEAIPTVKQIQTPSKPTSVLDELALNKDTKQAIDILAKNNIPITKGTVTQIASFLENGEGSLEQKLETISAMAKKGLEFTPVQIKSVHEALHGKGKISDLLNEIVPERNRKIPAKILKDSSSVEARIRAALQVGDIQKAIQLSKSASLPENVQRLLEKAEQLNVAAGQKLVAAVGNDATLTELLQKGESSEKIVNLLSKEGIAGVEDALKLETAVKTTLLKAFEPEVNTDSNVDNLLKVLKKEPDIQKVFAILEESLSEATLSNARSLAEAGRELAARQELMGALEQLKKESSSDVSVQQEVFQLNDDFVASLPIQSKDFIVTKITEKLSQMALDFKQVKRDITRNLQTVESLLQQQKPLAAAQAKPLLEATIKQLDQAILKSDMMLYTDMATEKKMLKASSQLAEAKSLLEKGDQAQASKIVQDVKNSIDKLIFKPSDTRMQHLVSKQFLQMEQPAPTQQLAQFESSMQAVRDVATGRQMFEHLRNMGVTYEADQAHYLVSKGQEEANSSMKNALLKLVQSNQDQAMAQKAEQALTQITGQQLLSKTDSSSLQSMMFTIPFLLQNQAEQVKVFVNAKNEQEKVDWENCSLYFLLETKKLGDVGITLSAVERTLSVTLKNDKSDFKEKIEPIALKAKERLEEIGYNIGSIQFTRFSEEKGAEQVKKQAPNPAVVQNNGRGYDFSV